MTEQEIIEMYNVTSLNEAGEITTYQNLKEHSEELAKRIAKRFKDTWEAACKAQMNAVYDHCQHSPQGTNGHAIKHWVKEVTFPSVVAKTEA